MKADRKSSRRERERERHREELLEAALELFAERGYHQVTMREIAARAEFALGTVYKLFSGKEALYRALLLTSARAGHAKLKAVLTAPRRNPVETIERFVEVKACLFTENRDVLRLYFAETRGAGFDVKAGLDKEVRALDDEILASLTVLFRRGIRRKIFRDQPPEMLAVALDGLTNAFLFHWLHTESPDAYEAYVPRILELFLKGALAG